MSTLKATNIQHASAADPAIVLATNGSATANLSSINSGQLGGSRNVIINGAMVVNQRGFTGTAGTTTSFAYTTDRFRIEHSMDGAVSAGQTTMNSTVGGNAYADGFNSALHYRVTTADASLSASQFAVIAQPIEGFNVQGFKKGTANAQQFTLSFWVRSSLTGTYIADLRDNDNTRFVSKSYTIDTANTWEKKTLTFPADTTGVFDNDNGLSLVVFWWLAAGSTYSGGTLGTTWHTTQANRAVGQVNLLATAGNNFFLTGVQLEVGPTATEFERRSIGDELALCQRYYQITAQAGGGNSPIAFCFQFSTTSSRAAVPLTVTMRTNPPILDLTGTPTLNDSSGVGVTLSSIIVNSGIVSNNSNTVGLVATTASRTAGPVGAWAGLNLKLAFDAEF